MSAKESNLLCNDCGQAFTTFLHEMAEHNAKVTCPHCGKVYDHPAAKILQKAKPKSPAKSGKS